MARNLNFRIAVTRLELLHSRKCLAEFKNFKDIDEKKLFNCYTQNERFFLEQLHRLLIEKENELLLKFNYTQSQKLN